MLTLQYEIPSKENLKSCKITKEFIETKSEPIYEYYEERDIQAKREMNN
jgi:ATP-dependent protease Clp ATPase subunit